MNGVAPDPFLLLAALMALFAASVYLFVGARIFARAQGGRHDRFALRCFGVWWIAFGLGAAINATTSAAVAFAIDDLALHVAGLYVFLLVTLIAFWSLNFYFLYLFTGKRRVLAPLTLYYFALYGFLLYLATLSEPIDFAVSTWQVALVYANPPEGILLAVTLALVLLPQVIGSMAYLLLAFRFDDPTTRWRIGLVATAIAIWFTSLFIANLVGVARTQWWPPIARGLGIASALAAFLAYHPPRWARERLHVRALSEPPAARSSDAKSTTPESGPEANSAGSEA